ncbi:MAG: prephenate dehydratase [Candidatus Omnitrophica bacterium]|nr:prephenate dehydratase [Candidatus Omnitrophota bacterium]
MKAKKLEDHRKEIDKIDSKIIALINARGKASCGIGQIKKKRNQPIYSPDRESHIYKKVTSKNKGPILDRSIEAVYREIMSACLSLEQPITVAYLGPELTFTHQASIKKFGSSVNYLSCDSISEVFNEVERENADYGVVPIENSTEGAISHTLDMFVDSSLMICSEVFYAIRHSLLCKRSNMKGIKRIYSNPHVFGQCRNWIEKNIPQAKLWEASSTVKAAEIAARHADAACIAGQVAAKRYKLKVLARSIEDSSDNTTRFLIIGKHASKPSGSDKTSVMFSVKDRPGILHDMLNAFKKKGINLTKIESRPSKKKLWKYYFFVDMEGHRDNVKIKNALKDLEKKCHFMKVLGSYPKGI